MQVHLLRLAAAVCSITLVHAHTSFTTLFVNGVSQGDGTCVRMNTVSGRVNFPIADITSDDMTCGQSGIKAVSRTCPIQVGDTVSFQFRSGPGSGSTESIVEGHSGPCAIYMKQMSSGDPLADGTFPTESPAGDGWFKIMYDDTDTQDQWCTERVNNTAEGVITTKIPSDLAPGYYLLRPELLALHAATNKDPQFYTGCAQVYISGGTGQANPETVAIPGYVKYSDRAMSWNLYNQTGADYPEYGPRLYKSGTDGAASSQIDPTSTRPVSSTVVVAQSSTTDEVTSTTSVAAVASDTATSEVASAIDVETTSTTTSTLSTPTCKGGLAKRRRRSVSKIHQRASNDAGIFACPPDTILELGNLCLPEVPHWRDSDASMRNCWASQKYCWEMADTCWKGRSPAVSYQKGEGCDLYAKRCTAVAEACKASIKEGPADEGKIITPEKVVLSGYGVQG